MVNTVFEKKKLVKYLIWTFAVSWGMQIAACLFADNLLLYQALLLLAMFTPMLGAWLSGAAFKGMGWKPHFKGKVKWILLAWLIPLVSALAGAALYFLIFPDAFTVSSDYLSMQSGQDIAKLLQQQGVDYQTYIVSQVIAAATYAPIMNMLAALGEETGWRGFMYPQLKSALGRKKGLVLGGILWGAWHFPIIIFAGYEYGKNYVGFPVVGMLVFCFITVMMGIVFDWLYEKAESIWIPSLVHGAVNACSGLALLVLNVRYADQLILGPVSNGLISGLPITVIAVTILIKSKERT